MQSFMRICAFDAFTLLTGRQEEHPACKKLSMRCWYGYLSGVRCRLFSYGPADVTASPNPIISCLIYRGFYRAVKGLCLSVCHKSVFYQNGYNYNQTNNTTGILVF